MPIEVLFIHSAGVQDGDEGSAPFVRNLREALGADYSVKAPLMPSPDDPSYEPWRREILKHLAAGPPPTILIGHSLGGSVLLKLLSEQAPPLRARGLFVVAAPFWRDQDWDVSQFVLRDDVARHLPEELPIHFYQSEDDDVVPVKHLARYAEALPQARITRVARGGHVFAEGLPELVRDIRAVAT